MTLTPQHIREVNAYLASKPRTYVARQHLKQLETHKDMEISNGQNIRLNTDNDSRALNEAGKISRSYIIGFGEFLTLGACAVAIYAIAAILYGLGS